MKKSLLLALLLFSTQALATVDDINIKADKQVEWHQNENKMVAVGNATATKNNMSLRGDQLIGYYENLNGKNTIRSMQAVGNVVMKSDKATAYGNTMDYDLQKDEVVLKGRPAKIATETESITATDNITYYPSQNKAIATGNVIVTDKDKNQIYSDNLTAYFKKNAKGDLEIDRAEIVEGVKIVAKDATVTAKRGTYSPQTGLIHLYEDVTITQANGNVLRGVEAESDLNTGVSKILSGANGGRVTGVFKEQKKANPNAKSK